LQEEGLSWRRARERGGQDDKLVASDATPLALSALAFPAIA
jgi:hypothetical protein